MNEHRLPEEVLNSAPHTPIYSVHHNRRPHTIARESSRATGNDFRGTQRFQRSRRLHAVFSTYADVGTESQIQAVKQHSVPGADLSPTQEVVGGGSSSNASGTTRTGPPPLWQTPVYEKVMAMPPHKQFEMNRIRKPQYWCKRAIRFKKKNHGVERHMSKYHQEDLNNYGEEDDAVKEIPGNHDAVEIVAALELIIQEWGLSKALRCRFARDSGSNMVVAGNIMGTDHAACIAHELHLVVSGLISKKRKKDQRGPAWETMVSVEPDVTINENEEDDELSEDDRAQMGELRDVTVDEMEAFLSETLAHLAMDEMAAMREIVQTFHDAERHEEHVHTSMLAFFAAADIPLCRHVVTHVALNPHDLGGNEVGHVQHATAAYVLIEHVED
ncbi:hypothetical protein ON010_g17137 [Phytophthora cinnamomi]|nr:hypothetical protein ON010_g17137 [Phytophthora cinnamomi]